MKQIELNNLKLFALKKLKEIDETSDTESGHIEADEVLCLLLNKLGFEDVVEAYNLIPKWYA